MHTERSVALKWMNDTANSDKRLTPPISYKQVVEYVWYPGYIGYMCLKIAVFSHVLHFYKLLYTNMVMGYMLSPTSVYHFISLQFLWLL